MLEVINMPKYDDQKILILKGSHLNVRKNVIEKYLNYK